MIGVHVIMYVCMYILQNLLNGNLVFVVHVFVRTFLTRLNRVIRSCQFDLFYLYLRPKLVCTKRSHSNPCSLFLRFYLDNILDVLV